MTDSTIAPPKTCDFLTTNISWLLDMRKGAIMKKASSTCPQKHFYACKGLSIDDIGAARGAVFQEIHGRELV